MIANTDASQEVARFCLDRGLVDLARFKQAETQSKASESLYMTSWLIPI
uniref:Uncharacterized protein n=1 Tax=Polynucleobacter necessarius subsp. necessarius (strain STIR1) TaxID=452638 RepID=B1XUD5_POLNS